MPVVEGKPTVKICGLQSVEVIKSIIHLPIAHIGFVFAKSKRQVTPQQAGAMISYLQSTKLDRLQQRQISPQSVVPEEPMERLVPLSVGVFVNPTQEELIETLRLAPLDVVQLHGQESPEFCGWVKSQLSVKLFKVFSVQSYAEEAAVHLQLDPYKHVVDAILLDTYDPIYGGGSGKTFAWDCIPAYLKWARGNGVQLIVAGGLQPDNVSELMIRFQPDGVDVSSGVETVGVKDIDKITAFVERVNELGSSTR